MLEEAHEVVEADRQGTTTSSRENSRLASSSRLSQPNRHRRRPFHSRRSDRAHFPQNDPPPSSRVRRRYRATAGEVLRNWEAIKEAELEAKGKRSDEGSMLDGFDKAPCRDGSVPDDYQGFARGRLARCRVGIGKLDEEVEELKQAVGTEHPTHAEIAGEVGDLLFVAVNVARLLGIDPESALKASNRKFRRRFRYIEDRLREQSLCRF